MIKILSTIALASVIFSGFNGCNNSGSQPQNQDSLIFKTGVQGACDNNNLNTAAYRVNATKCAELVSSKFDGDNLSVVVRQNAFCSSKFNLSSTISGGKIILRADDTSNEAVRCMCNFNLTYTFSGAKNSSYQLDYSGKVFNNEPCTSTFEVK